MPLTRDIAPAAGGRLATASALIRPLAHAVDWVPLAVTIPLSLGMAGFGASQPDVALTCVRFSAVLLAAAAAFALIDPMDASTAALPVPRSHRQWLRTLLALAAVAGTWAAIVVLVGAACPATLPWGGLTLEAAVLTVTTLAATARATHHVPDKPAALTGIATTLLLTAAALPLPTTMWAAPGDPAWSDSHRQWGAALLLALPALLRANAHSPASPVPILSRVLARRPRET
ncbi:hypothetical protein, partial [Streptomyces sp. SID3343]|uniref:hypothetical protein n=1 Tax=Streptomyces sp. SID3343 TaxID=2690260 RepID=UPI00136E743E